MTDVDDAELREYYQQRLLPQPQRLTFNEGTLKWQGEAFALQLQGSFTAGQHAQLVETLQPFVTVAAPMQVDTGRAVRRANSKELPLRVYCGGEPVVHLGSNGPKSVDKRDAIRCESYSLTLTPNDITLSAPTHLGVLRGTQTLTQILAHCLARQEAGQSSELPCLAIEDQPAFAWRGVLIDVARHFIELPVLLRTLDGMAHHKLNVMHLHLTDDQAYRFPSAAYTKLNASGPCYTREELKALVAYGEALGIRIVPELDMPGHTTSWLAAYPEWSLYEIKATSRFGVHKGCLNPALGQTYEVISTLLTEFAQIFPDGCVHIGGDEVHPLWWSDHPEMRSFMQERGFATPRDLQAHFNQRVSDVLAKLGKRMLAWDEAVHETLPENVMIQAWRGMTARDAAVARGHECIVSAPYYLDLFYPSDLHTRFAPLQPIDEALAAEDALLADERLAHVAGGLEWTRQWRDRPDDLAAGDAGKAALARQVLGAEACLWSELVTGELLDVRLWSRLPLIAELFWRGEAVNSGYTRTAHSLRSWQVCGGPAFALPDTDAQGDLLHEELLSKAQLKLLAVPGIDVGVAPLLGVLEPSKWYSRLLGSEALAARLQGQEMPQARPYTVDTELRTIACVISPESFVSAQFFELCERWLVGPLSETDHKAVTQWITAWGSQVEAVKALTLADETSQQLVELAQRLKQLADVVHTLLDKFSQQRLDADTAAILAGGVGEAGDELADWAAPVGELMLAPAVALLRVKNRLLATEPQFKHKKE